MSQKRINGAVLVYLIFTTLWLVMGALGMSGVRLAEGAVANSLLQGNLAGFCMLVLAARLKNAEKMAVGLGLAIWMTPIITAGLPQLGLPRPGGSSKAEVKRRLAEQWAMPHELRQKWARSATLSAIHLERYVEAPEVRAELERRGQVVVNFMHDHEAEVLQIRQKLYRQGRAQDPAKVTSADWETTILDGLGNPASRFQQQAATVLTELEALGMNVEATPLSEADRQNAVSYAQNWLCSHGDWVEKILSSGPTYTIEGDAPANFPEDPEAAWRRQKAASNPGVWVVLLGIGLAWAGRESLNRPLDPATLLPLALQGLRGLVRPGGMPRILAGLAIMASSFILVFLMLMLGSGAGLRRLFAGVMLTGAALVYSGLTLSQDPGQG
ncbi:hypothetical protein IV102_25240 [bacterium]|nr:hypothetical protein [bacterium]